MSELLPSILSAIKVELQTMNRSLSKLIKTHSQVLSEEWVSKDQAMAILKISLRTLDTLKASGKLAFSKVGNIIYFRTIDIENLLNLNYVSISSTDNHSTFKSTFNVSKS